MDSLASSKVVTSKDEMRHLHNSTVFLFIEKYMHKPSLMHARACGGRSAHDPPDQQSVV